MIEDRARIIPDVLRRRAATNPDLPAIVVDGVGQTTYAEWHRASSGFARRLVAGGVLPGDRVALAFSNLEAIAFSIAYFAIHKAGAVAVPVNVRLAPPEIARILDHAEARAVVAEPALVEKLPPASARLLLQVQWRDLLGAAGGDDLQVPREPSDLADILYTSGTTGFPKGVAATHENVLFMGGGGGMVGKLFEGRAFLHAIPMFTFAGTHGMQFIPLRGAMTSVVLPEFDAGRWLALVEERRAAMSFVVPSMALLMLEHPDACARDLSSMKVMISGAAPMPPPAILRLAELLPECFLVNLYGLTEGGGAACAMPPGEARSRPGSVGQPIPPTEVRIVREDGSACAADEVGEVHMRAPTRRRYFRDDEATARTWTEDGWLRTGDLGRLDADGYLVLEGRGKDLVIRGGFNVYPGEVEAVICEHPSVLEAAVVGVPHEVLGEDVAAFVVPRQGRAIDSDALSAFCRERLADYKCPRRIRVVAELPRNALGKVLKRVLREETG